MFLMAKLELPGGALLAEGRRLEPVSLEANMVGFCSRCGQDMESLAYHRSEEAWYVSARCQSGHPALMRYDLEWSWLGDLDLELAEEFKGISSLPRQQLETIFTASELRAMEACERGEPYTRQNLYRARTKYEKFERLFGTRINL
jgi:hypothetical protein